MLHLHAHPHTLTHARTQSNFLEYSSPGVLGYQLAFSEPESNRILFYERCAPEQGRDVHGRAIRMVRLYPNVRAMRTCILDRFANQTYHGTVHVPAPEFAQFWNNMGQRGVEFTDIVSARWATLVLSAHVCSLCLRSLMTLFCVG